MSENTVNSYCRDIKFFLLFIDEHYEDITTIDKITKEHIIDYIKYLHQKNISARSQARFLSSLKSFYKYLQIEDLVTELPCNDIDLPKISMELPDVLSVEEIEQILKSIDLSEPNGARNRAIIEVLYGCGLRVSELVNLKISNIDFKESYIRVIGKGNKERLVPIGSIAQNQLSIYINQIRSVGKIKSEYSDIVFLNRRGGKLSREMIFLIVKECVYNAGINKNVSPHTFRHSFATHLIQNGADIRIVQDMLGHESIITTEIYTHIDKTYLKKVIDKCHPLYKKNLSI